MVETAAPRVLVRVAPQPPCSSLIASSFQDTNICTSPLCGQVRAGFCLAAGIMCIRFKCSFNSIPQQKGLINLFRQNKKQTPKPGQNSRFRWKFDHTCSEERSKLTFQEKPCCCWKARETIDGVTCLVVPYMPSAGRQSVNCCAVIGSKRASARKNHHTGVPKLQTKQLEALVLPSRSAPMGSLR